ncbi:MAG: MFS transporter [Alphaproteobacteria bacterium]|nr:MFS transporter [Alphaproteobacteria bacterium]MBL7096384.1 MFS transporter [Alphaproteobacteria bacterium]
MVEAVAATPEHQLGSTRAKFFLAVGSIGWGVKDSGITGLLLIFYNQVLGAPAYLVSFAIGMALVVDAFYDPVIGIVSDNWRSKWGRRHPFMYAAALPVGLFYWAIWNPSPAWSDMTKFVYLLVCAISVRIAIATFEIPSTALLAELTSDYTKRTEFLSWRYLFGVVGAALFSSYAFFFLFVPDATHKFGQLNPAGYPKYSIIAAVIMIGSILVSCLGLHRYIPHFIVPEPKHQTIGTFFRELWDTLTIKPFLMLLISGMFSGMAAGLNGGMGTYVLTFFWKLKSQQLAAFAFVLVGAAILASAVVVPITKRFEKKHAAMACSVLGIVFGTGPYIAALFGWTPDYSAKWLFPSLLGLFVVISAIGVAASVLVGSMITDVVEYGALQTGRRNEGTFFAALSLMGKSISGVGIFFSGLVISLAHFPVHADPATIDPAIMRHLFYVYLPVLTVLHLIAFYFFWSYHITRAQHVENVKRLAEEYTLTKVGVAADLVGAQLPPAPAAVKVVPGE